MRIACVFLALPILTGTLSATLVGCAASNEEEDVGESEGHLLAGRHLSEAEVVKALRDADFPEDVVPAMTCTAKYESSFYERATNANNNGSIDRGLFQINSIHVGGTRGCPSTAEALFDAATNAKCARSIYGSQGLNAWYGYRRHKAECDAYRVAANANAESTTAASGTPPPGGCWSATLQDMTDALACVQSRSNQLFYQCKDGSWYRGVENGAGPYGACSSIHSL